MTGWKYDDYGPQGPISLERLRELYRKKRLGDDTKVWPENASIFHVALKDWPIFGFVKGECSLLEQKEVDSFEASIQSLIHKKTLEISAARIREKNIVDLTGCTVLGSAEYGFVAGDRVDLKFDSEVRVLYITDADTSEVIPYIELVEIAISGPGKSLLTVDS